MKYTEYVVSKLSDDSGKGIIVGIFRRGDREYEEIFYEKINKMDFGYIIDFDSGWSVYGHGAAYDKCK